MRFSIFFLCALLSAPAVAAGTASGPAAPYQWAMPVKQDANLYHIASEGLNIELPNRALQVLLLLSDN